MRILEKLNQVNRINWVIKIFLQELSGSNWINEETNSECNLNGPRVFVLVYGPRVVARFLVRYSDQPMSLFSLIQKRAQIHKSTSCYKTWNYVGLIDQKKIYYFGFRQKKNYMGRRLPTKKKRKLRNARIKI